MSGETRRTLNAKSVLGLLSLACALALTSPGVQVVRADEPRSEAPAAASYPDVESGGVCSVDAQGPAGVDFARATAAAVQQLQSQVPAGAEVPIQLNSRGYNYRQR